MLERETAGKTSGAQHPIWDRYGGFHSHGGTPLSLDGLFHGKSQSKMDDLGVSLFQETSYEILVNTPILKRMEHGLILNFVWSHKKLVRRVVSSQKKLPIHHCLGCLNGSKWQFFFFKFRYFKD